MPSGSTFSTLSSTSSSLTDEDSVAPPPLPDKSPRHFPLPIQPSEPSPRFKHEREKLYTSTPPAKLIDLLIKEEYEGQQTRKLLNAAISHINSPSQRVTADEQLKSSGFVQDIKISELTARAQQQLAEAQLEAETYKLQLEATQQEAQRVKHLLTQAEAQREFAEQSAIRAKALARRLKEEKAIAVAREVGRREGFDEGLRRGRVIALAREEARRLALPAPPRDHIIGNGSAYIEEQIDSPPPRESVPSRSRTRSSRRDNTDSSESRPRRRRSSPQNRNRSQRVDRAQPANTTSSRATQTGSSRPPSISSQVQRSASSPLPPSPRARAARTRSPATNEPTAPPSEPGPSAPFNEPQNSRQELLMASSLSRSVSEPTYNATLQDAPTPRLVVEPRPSTGPAPVTPLEYAPIPPPPPPLASQPVSPLPRTPPPMAQPMPTSHPVGYTLYDPPVQRTRSSPDIFNSPASSHTSMTGLSSSLGSHLLSFPSGRDERRNLSSYPRELSVIPEDVSTSTPGTASPAPPGWPQRERTPERTLYNKRSVEEWRSHTEDITPSPSFAMPSSSNPSMQDITPSPSFAGRSAANPSMNNQYLRPPNSGDGFGLNRRPSSSSGHSIQFQIVPPSRPSSVGYEDQQNSTFLSPHHPSMPVPVTQPSEPPVIPTRTGFSPVTETYQSDVPVYDELPPGFVPQAMTSNDGTVVDLTGGRVVSTPSGSPWNRNTPQPPLGMPYPNVMPGAADMEGLTSTFGSFAVNQPRPPGKGILLNGTPKPPPFVPGPGAAFPYPGPPPQAAGPSGITWSRSLGDIPPGMAVTSPDSNMSSPRRKRLSLNAGKTPALNHQILPPGSFIGSRSSTPAGTSPLMFTRPPRSDTSSVDRGGPSGFIPPMMGMPEPSTGPYMSMPAPSVPGMSMPMPSVPGMSMPMPSAPGMSIPAPSVPGMSMPMPSVPGMSMSMPSAPGMSMPMPSVPGMSMPMPSVRGMTSPGDDESEHYIPDPTTLANTKMNARGGPWQQ